MNSASLVRAKSPGRGNAGGIIDHYGVHLKERAMKESEEKQDKFVKVKEACSSQILYLSMSTKITANTETAKN